MTETLMNEIGMYVPLSDLSIGDIVLFVDLEVYEHTSERNGWLFQSTPLANVHHKAIRCITLRF